MAKKNYETVSHKKIMEYLQKNAESLVRVNDIDRHLKEEEIEVNISTIYRYLNRLSKDGTVMKYVAPKGEMSSFQYIGSQTHNCKEHLHLQCVVCNRILHLECRFMEEISNHVMHHHGFALQCESSILYGVCEECGGRGKTRCEK